MRSLGSVLANVLLYTRARFIKQDRWVAGGFSQNISKMTKISLDIHCAPHYIETSRQSAVKGQVF